MTRTSAAVPIVVGLALFLSVVVAFATLLATVSAEEAGAEQPATDKADGAPEQSGKHASEADPVVEELPDDATLRKMKVRELKAILEKKGPEAMCLACTSKQEYIDRIRETADWPTVEKKESASDEDTLSMDQLRDLFNKGRDEEHIKDLKKRLRDAGIDTSNIFTGADFDSEAFANQFKNWERAEDRKAGDASAKDEVHVDL